MKDPLEIFVDTNKVSKNIPLSKKEEKEALKEAESNGIFIPAEIPAEIPVLTEEKAIPTVDGGPAINTEEADGEWVETGKKDPEGNPILIFKYHEN